MLLYLDTFNKIGERVDGLIREELDIQGHNATGKLSNSIRHEVEGVSINGFANDYSIFVNNRSRPHFINKGGVQSLKEWLSVKGIDQKALWPIIKKIQAEGTPTSGSYRFSKNGKRTDFVSDVITNKKNIITDLVKEELASLYGMAIEDILGKQKILK